MNYEDNKHIRERQNQQLKDVQLLESMLNQAGFQTNKGSNTSILAGVVVDFINRVIDNRRNDLSILSLWETNDMNVLVPLLYDRYRLYNERHQPKTYDIKDVPISGIFERVPGFHNIVAINSNIACQANPRKFIISKLDNESPSGLGVQYADLFAGSRLVCNGVEFFESFTSEFGVHQERDFIILPNETGEAVFYPITDFRLKLSESSEPLELTLLTKPLEETEVNLDLVKDKVEITADFLRFVLTNLMQKFAKYRGLDVNELENFIKLRYKVETLVSNNECIIKTNHVILKEIREFAERNISKFFEVEINTPSEISVTLKCEDPKIESMIVDYVKQNLNTFEERRTIKEKIFHLVDMAYASTFGLDANFAKSQNPTKIEIFEELIKTHQSYNYTLVNINESNQPNQPNS